MGSNKAAGAHATCTVGCVGGTLDDSGPDAGTNPTLHSVQALNLFCTRALIRYLCFQTPPCTALASVGDVSGRSRHVHEQVKALSTLVGHVSDLGDDARSRRDLQPSTHSVEIAARSIICMEAKTATI